MTESDFVRSWIENYMTNSPCSVCGGTRLKPESLSVLFRGKNIAEVTSLSINKALEFFEDLALEGNEAIIGEPLVREIVSRLRFLCNVGVDYLTLYAFSVENWKRPK